jgi:GTPase
VSERKSARLTPAEGRIIQDSLYPVIDPNGSPLRALVAGLEWGQEAAWEIDDSLDELSGLAETAGLQVVGRQAQRREKPDPATFFGKGKVQELIELQVEQHYDMMVVDDDLSPSQQRNLDKRLQVPVVDRAGLIIAIFGQRATTREAKLQVELARLQYLLPRLSGAWTHLERQMGGIGGRGGPGETQIELDRRILRDRIAAMKREIAQVRAHRGRARARRRTGPPNVALVGYTNAGKSTLMNRLTQAGVLAENKLFATLDPTVRKMPLPGGGAAVISDTVGFIQKLPHQLIDAFRATLEELESADLLLHVVDASHPQAREQEQTVVRVLGELGLQDKPMLTVYNKADLLPQSFAPPNTDAVVISAATGKGVGALKARIARRLGATVAEVEVTIPLAASDLVALFRREGFLVREDYRPDGARLHGHLPQRLIPAFRRVGKVRIIKAESEGPIDRAWSELDEPLFEVHGGLDDQGDGQEAEALAKPAPRRRSGGRRAEPSADGLTAWQPSGARTPRGA